MKPITRRTLLAVAPMILPARARGANDRIRVGVIGAGNRSGLLIDQLPEDAEVAAIADCYVKKAEELASKRKASWLIFQDYRRLLDRKDLDAVIIGATDHARALLCIHSCQAGKDVYAEKPLTLYVAEGRAIVKAAERYKRVFQVGSQQRSMAMNQIGCKFIRDGGLGAIHFVQGCNYPSAKIWNAQPGQPVPDGMDWNQWQGQAAERPYHEQLYRGWVGWRDYSGGEMTNWGAHGLDQIQSALGMDGTGPVELWPLADSAPGAVAFRYANGVPVRLELPMGDLNGGAVFAGKRGRMEIVRNGFRLDPPALMKEVELPPKEEVAKWDRALWQARYHMQNWLDAIRTRGTPLAGPEIGHRSVTVSHLANITRELNRKLRWNPREERFEGDAQANALLTRPRRKGFELPA
ncbi:MAG: gfo/Idh/MocA family oxidoreductase [Candidatus Solibacter sp.]|nr:gfo/Idh/MocA family oxidoreductase [Candidatus Solibacter sp.]